MIARFLSAAALAGLLLPTAALAADLGEGIYEPPARSWCPPPGTPKAYRQLKFGQANKPLLYVTPYDPPYQIYVEPQVAFLVSDSCPNQYRQNWYEGKLWYYNAGSPQGPDSFRIIKQN
ncbi:MAG: hypothetical protein ABI399_06635 [Bauldia sp.]